MTNHTEPFLRVTSSIQWQVRLRIHKHTVCIEEYPILKISKCTLHTLNIVCELYKIQTSLNTPVLCEYGK